MKSHFLSLPVILLLMLALFGACKEAPKSEDTGTPSTPKQVTVPAFNKDSAYAFVQQQVDFGPRTMGSEGHEACARWIVQKLQNYGTEVTEQTFPVSLYTGEEHTGTNIMAKINPDHARRILLAAHWDTRHIADQDADPDKKDQPILGADDGASGVAVLLELARVIASHPIDLGVDLVFFDAEDHGHSGGSHDTYCLGSQYWSKNLPVKGRPQYGVLLDMVGSSAATFPKEGISMHYASGIVEKVWSLAQSMGYGHLFVNRQIGNLTDDHLFVNQLAGIPMIDVINYTTEGFGSYWHTHDDDMDVINKDTLRATGQVMLALLYNESVEAL